MRKLSVFQFYRMLEYEFQSIQKLDLLQGINIEEEGWENSDIMTKLARELTKIVHDGELKIAFHFMNKVEEAFQYGGDTLINYLYPDFLVTIMEQEKEPREYLKSLMGALTKQHYKKLLHFYRERYN